MSALLGKQDFILFASEVRRIMKADIPETVFTLTLLQCLAHGQEIIDIVLTVFFVRGNFIQETEAERADLKAQARFVRAYYYWLLLRKYGPVPLLPEENRVSCQLVTIRVEK